VSVSDEGDGFPENFDPAASAGLGLKIVSSMAGHDLASSIEVDRSVPFARIAAKMALKEPAVTPADPARGGSQSAQ